MKSPLCPFLIEFYEKEAETERSQCWEEGRLSSKHGPPAFQYPLAPGKTARGSGRKATQKVFKAQPALPTGVRGQSLAVEYCPTHWGFPLRLLRLSLGGWTENSARALSRLGPEPRSGGEEPRRAAGPSRRHTARPLQPKRKS